MPDTPLNLANYKLPPLQSNLDKYKLSPQNHQQTQQQPSIFQNLRNQISQNPVANTMGGIVRGVGNEVASTAFNLGSLGLKGADLANRAVGNKALSGLTDVPQDIQQATSNNTIPEKIGGVAADIGMLSAPTDIVAAGKEAMPLIKTAEEAPGLVKFGAGVAQKVLNALPESGVGFGFGLSRGQSPSQALGTGAAFGILSGLGEIAGDTWNAIKGGVVDNISKAIGVKGSMSADRALQRVPQITRAFQTIKNLAPQITVLDSSGVEKTFIPEKSTFPEMLQAWTKARDLIYNSYTDLAKQAGDEGAQFTHQDFNSIVKSIQDSVKDGTTAFKNKANSLVNDLVSNFGQTTKEGGFVFNNTPLSRIQTFIENVNKDVNPVSDSAGALVSGTTSRSLRDIMDKKIEQSTGEGYQKLRSSYADLKSIEKDLVNQTKRAINKTSGGIGKYIETYGNIDTIVGLLTQSPTEFAKGLVIKGTFGLQRLLADPETAMQRAFQQLGETAEKSPTTKRLFGR